MISEQGLHWARHEVERRLGQLDEESRGEVTDALIFFKGKGVGPEEVYWLLAEECLAVEGANRRFENQLALAEASVAHLANAEAFRSFARESLERALDSFRKGIADGNFPHPGVFRGVEHGIEFLRNFPEEEQATRERYGLAADKMEAIARVEHGSIGHFADEMSRRVGASHDEKVAALIGPAIGWLRLEKHTVRNCLVAYRKKYT